MRYTGWNEGVKSTPVLPNNATLCNCCWGIIKCMIDDILYMLTVSIQNEPVGCWGPVWCLWRRSVSSRTSQARWQLVGRNCWGDRRSHWASWGWWGRFLEQMVTWVGRVGGNPRCSFISSCVMHFFNGRGSWQVTTTLRSAGNTLEFVLEGRNTSDWEGALWWCKI